jgi:hypothetical protein
MKFSMKGTPLMARVSSLQSVGGNAEQDISLWQRSQDPSVASQFALLALALSLALTSLLGCTTVSKSTEAESSVSQAARVPAVSGGRPMTCEQAERALVARYHSCQNGGIASTCFHLLWERFSADFPQCAQRAAATTCLRLCRQDGAPSHCRLRCQPAFVDEIAKERELELELKPIQAQPEIRPASSLQR